jgi:hypothetical protein
MAPVPRGVRVDREVRELESRNPNDFKIFGSKKTKRPKQSSLNRLRSSMTDEAVP